MQSVRAASVCWGVRSVKFGEKKVKRTVSAQGLRQRGGTWFAYSDQEPLSPVAPVPAPLQASAVASLEFRKSLTSGIRL